MDPTAAIPAAYADSVDHLYVDADCKQMREAGFIIQKVDAPLYKIADEFKEDVDYLRGHMVSTLQTAVDSTVNAADQDGKEVSKKDIGTYYRFWSRIGFGHKLVTAPQEMKTTDGKPGPFYAAMEELGPYVHFAIMPGLKRPLGMKVSDLLGDAGIPSPGESERESQEPEDLWRGHPWQCHRRSQTISHADGKTPVADQDLRECGQPMAREVPRPQAEYRQPMEQESNRGCPALAGGHGSHLSERHYPRERRGPRSPAHFLGSKSRSSRP